MDLKEAVIAARSARSCGHSITLVALLTALERVPEVLGEIHARGCGTDESRALEAHLRAAGLHSDTWEVCKDGDKWAVLKNGVIIGTVLDREFAEHCVAFMRSKKP